MVPTFHFDGIASPLAFALTLMPSSWFALRALGRRRRNARIADAPNAGHGLAPGERVISGRVAFAEGQSVAMRVEIEQSGSESESSGSYSWKWTEQNRRVHVAPFYVVQDDGTRVRVEPTREALLVDDLDGKILVDNVKRIKIAELVPDELVWVSGLLVRGRDPESRDGGAYRTMAEAFILTAPEGRPLLLSSEPLERRYRARQWQHGRYAVLFILWTLLTLLFSIPYFDRMTSPRIDGVVESCIEKHDDDGDSTGFRVTVRTADARSFDDKMPAPLVVGRRMHVVDARLFPLLGDDSALSMGYPLFAFGAFAIALIYRSRARSALPWYRRKWDESGPGTLADNT